MKKFPALVLAAISISIALLNACQRELSCEACRGNNPPIAVAGPDQTITFPRDSVLLDGSGSSDPNGKINAWQWIKIAGPSTANILIPDSAKTEANALITGVYQFELTVKDNRGLSAKDTVMITVGTVAVNHPPVACAGADQTITPPSNSVILDGSCSTDPDTNISSYLWTKIAGPTSYSIANANAVQTQVSNLADGVYLFELKVTDAGGLFSKDTVTITVSPATALACSNSNRPTINVRLTPICTLSQARAGMAVASAGNKIFFAGGTSAAGESSSRVDVYDIAANRWHTAELSLGRFNDIAAVVNGNKVFFAGGEISDGTLPTDVVDIYDVSTNAWAVAHLSLAGDNIAAAAVGDKVLFAGGLGGFSGGEARGTRVDIYNLETDAWSTASLSEYKVNGHVAVTANNKVYISGGSTSWLGNAFTNKIEIYDNASNTWSTATMQEERFKHAGIVSGNKIYWGGGLNTCSVEIKDLNTGNSTTQYFFRSTGWSYAVAKDNKIVFFGRHFDLTNPNSSPATDKVDIYDPVSGTWSIGVLPFSIGEEASIISVNNTIYVAGGLVNGVYPDKVWKLEF